MPQACVTKSTPLVYRKLPVSSPSTYTPPRYKRTPPPRIKAPLYQPRPEAFRFSHGRGERETRVTGDEPQETMGRVQLSPSRLPLRAHFHRERHVWYEAASVPCIEINLIYFDAIKLILISVNAKRILISTAVACFEAPFCSLWHNPLCL